MTNAYTEKFTSTDAFLKVNFFCSILGIYHNKKMLLGKILVASCSNKLRKNIENEVKKYESF